MAFSLHTGDEIISLDNFHLEISDLIPGRLPLSSESGELNRTSWTFGSDKDPIARPADPEEQALILVVRLFGFVSELDRGGRLSSSTHHADVKCGL